MSKKPPYARAIGLAAALVSLAASPLVAGLPIGSADISVLKVDDPDPVPAGTALVYTITVSNEGPDDAASTQLSDPLPAGTTFQSLAMPGGWACGTPVVGVNGTVTCTIDPFPVGSAVFTLTVLVDGSVANGTVLSNTVTITSTTADPSPGSESATADTTVSASVMTVIAITKTDAPDPVLAGNNIAYTITADNNNGMELASAAVSDTLPAATTFVALTPAAGWICATPAIGTGGTISCTIAPWPAGSAVFDLAVQVAASVPGGTVIGNTAQLAVTSDSGQSTMQVAATTTSVLAPTQLSATKSASGSFSASSTVTYTVVLTNTSTYLQADYPSDEFSDTLPAGLTLVNAFASAGVAAAVGNTATWNGALAAGASVTITITATITAAAGATISNQGTVWFDGVGDGLDNDTSALTDDTAVAGATDPTDFVVAQPSVVEVPTLGAMGLAVLALLLGAGAAMVLKRGRRLNP